MCTPHREQPTGRCLTTKLLSCAAPRYQETLYPGVTGAASMFVYRIEVLLFRVSGRPVGARTVRRQSRLSRMVAGGMNSSSWDIVVEDCHYTRGPVRSPGLIFASGGLALALAHEILCQGDVFTVLFAGDRHLPVLSSPSWELDSGCCIFCLNSLEPADFRSCRLIVNAHCR